MGIGQRITGFSAYFLDDATRVVPHAAFRFSESYEAFLPVFKSALLKRGVPKRLFCDNGAAYRCRHLRVVCASLGIQLVHGRPYHPAGKDHTSYCHLLGTIRRVRGVPLGPPLRAAAGRSATRTGIRPGR